LRETGKKRPDEVFEWLVPRAHRVSGVTIREAVKYLPQDRREALLGSYESTRSEGARRSVRSGAAQARRSSA
jgi:hypothetical protein